MLMMNLKPKTSCGYLLLLYLILQVSEGFLFGDDDDKEKSTTACYLGNDKLRVECKPNEKIQIGKVEYGSEPVSSCDSPRERNNCMQYSRTISTRVKKQCDGQVKCDVKKTPISEIPMNEVVPIQNTCGVGGTFYEKVAVNFIKITYTCIEYVFCNELTDEVVNLRLGTKSYPERSTTNPTCECTFESSDKKLNSIAAVTSCNGTVMFNVDSTVYEDGKYVDKSEQFLCKNKVSRKFETIGRGKQNVKLKISVDGELSSDSSSFSFLLTSYILTRDGSIGSRNRDATVKVSCVQGAIVLSTTMKYLVYVAAPCSVVLLVLLIVIYCVCNKRRRRRQRIKRSLEKELRLQNGDVEVQSGDDSPALSSPPSARHKPDGKIDSDSDDDLAEIATLLHTRNKQRRLQEVAHRHMFDEEMPWLDDRKLNHHSTKTAVDRMAERGYSTPPENPRPPPPRHTTRSHSAANLHSTTPPSMDFKPFKNSKSISNSRSSVRSTKRRAPLPPAYPLTSQPETPEPLTSNNITCSEPATQDEDVSGFPPPPQYAAVQYTPDDETCIISSSRDNSRAGSRNNTENVHISKNNNNSPKKKTKNKNKKKIPYYNKYHVERPKRPNKSTIGAKSSDGDENGGSMTKRPSVAGFGNTRTRRYSGDSQESDKASDHEFEDLEQIDVMGMGDEMGMGDDMDEF